jgi:hypothetical protein
VAHSEGPQIQEYQSNLPQVDEAEVRQIEYSGYVILPTQCFLARCKKAGRNQIVKIANETRMALLEGSKLVQVLPVN